MNFFYIFGELGIFIFIIKGNGGGGWGRNKV